MYARRTLIIEPKIGAALLARVRMNVIYRALHAHTGVNLSFRVHASLLARA